MFDAWWNYRLAGDIWIHRGDIPQGHFVLNNAVRPLISALFICNGEYIPHDKWILHMSRTLDWLPPHWEKTLDGIISVPDSTQEGLELRQFILHQAWTSIDQALCRRMGISGVNSTQIHFQEMLSFLLKSAPIPVGDWTFRYPLQSLNSDPFHAFVRIADGQIHVSRKRFLSLRPEDLYSWQYQVVKSVTG